jgi:hypothetical protein
MAPVPRSITRAGLIRLARITLILLIIVDVICGVGFFYFLGLAKRPHHLLLASVWTGVFVVVVGATTGWLYWLNMRRARRLPDTDGYADVSQRRERALVLVRAFRHMNMSDEETVEKLADLERLIPTPHWLDFMFQETPELSDEQVVDRALAYRPVAP